MVLLGIIHVVIGFPSPCGVMEFEPRPISGIFVDGAAFPSPCGVMEFEPKAFENEQATNEFPSPCGVMEFEPNSVHR